MHRVLVLCAILIAILAVAPRADALLAATAYCPTSVAPLPASLPRTGALIVTNEPCESRRDRRRTIASTFSAAPEALVDDVLAPGLHRYAPEGGFLPGMHTIEGLGDTPHGLEITDTDATPPPAPSVRSILRSNRRVRVQVEEIGPDAMGWTRATRVTMRLRQPVPEGVVAIAVRWTQWADSQGGVYGAWTRVTPGERRFVLLCDAADDCDRGRGQLPRRDEHFVARFIDANGLVSEPSTEWVVMGVPP